jgi:hypothetical protein
MAASDEMAWTLYYRVGETKQETLDAACDMIKKKPGKSSAH